MTNPIADVLDDLARLGIELATDGDQLRYRPVERMTPALAARIKVCREGLLDLLRRGGKRYTPRELALLARADLTPDDVPPVSQAKDALSALGPLRLVRMVDDAEHKQVWGGPSIGIVPPTSLEDHKHPSPDGSRDPSGRAGGH
ncbi:MAG: hypothetical protein ACKVW3_09415 [Phycisphaerales bacterium]